MTDPALTPAQEEAVRRRLADARHTEPIPDDVAARLDRVLVGLESERSSAPVVDLAARRHRRTAVKLLVAAAAVIVAGVGLTQLVDGGAGMNASNEDSGEAPAAAPPTAEMPEGADNRSPSPPTSGWFDAATVDPDTFRAYARKAATLTTEQNAAKDLAGLACPTPAGDEEFVPVHYQRGWAILIYRAPHDGVQRVDLFRCGGDDTLLRSVVIPAP